MTSEAPERIWLQWVEPYCDDNTWCVDKINDDDAEYTRTDLHQQAIEAAEARGKARAVGEAVKLADEAACEFSTIAQTYPEDSESRDRCHARSREAIRIRDQIRALSPTPADPVAEADSFDALISDAKSEAQRAMQKFPQPNYVISKVAEEAGEVVKAAIHCAEGRESASEVRAEMKQLIAMLYRLWAEGDGVHGLRALAQKEGE